MAAPPVTGAQPLPRKAKSDSAGASQPLVWRVLIVDDHHSHRELARVLFQAVGFRVQLCSGGDEAVEIASVEPFDLILMDRNMPGCSGDEAAWRLRAPNSRSRQALIISHSTDPPRGLSAAAYDGAVSKPISTSQIIELMQACAERFGGARC